MENTTKEWQEVKSSWIKWGKVGDNVEGTLIDVREVDSQLPGKEGTKVKVYELKCDRGSFHELDNKKNPVEPALTIEANEIYLVGGRQGIDTQMRRIKIGQKVRMLFAEEKEAKKKGFNALKIVKVLTNGAMDEGWLQGHDLNVADMMS
jgi:hypothetical protein